MLLVGLNVVYPRKLQKNKQKDRGKCIWLNSFSILFIKEETFKKV